MYVIQAFTPLITQISGVRMDMSPLALEALCAHDTDLFDRTGWVIFKRARGEAFAPFALATIHAIHWP